jgi:hypothetical protein
VQQDDSAQYLKLTLCKMDLEGSTDSLIETVYRNFPIGPEQNWENTDYQISGSKFEPNASRTWSRTTFVLLYCTVYIVLLSPDNSPPFLSYLKNHFTVSFFKIAVVWNTAPCSPHMNQRFGVTYHLLPQGSNLSEYGRYTFLRNVGSVTDHTVLYLVRRKLS